MKLTLLQQTETCIFAGDDQGRTYTMPIGFLTYYADPIPVSHRKIWCPQLGPRLDLVQYDPLTRLNLPVMDIGYYEFELTHRAVPDHNVNCLCAFDPESKRWFVYRKPV